MAWLLRDGEVLASIDISPRKPGVIGSLSCDGQSETTVYVAPVRVVHTLGAATRVDVAFLNDEYLVTGLSRMSPHRLTIAPLATKAVLRAPAGSFDRWSLCQGDRLEVRP